MAFEQADAVFRGRVTDVRRGKIDSVIVLDVLESWKCVEETTAEIMTAGDEAACGITLDVGDEFLIYAEAEEDGGLWTGICSRTTSDFTGDLEALADLGITPLELTGVSPPDSDPASGPFGLALCGAGTLPFLFASMIGGGWISAVRRR